MGAAVKAGLGLAAALAFAAALLGAFLFAMGNMAFHAQWLSLLALACACTTLLIAGTSRPSPSGGSAPSLTCALWQRPW